MKAVKINSYKRQEMTRRQYVYLVKGTKEEVDQYIADQRANGFEPVQSNGDVLFFSKTLSPVMDMQRFVNADGEAGYSIADKEALDDAEFANQYTGIVGEVIGKNVGDDIYKRYLAKKAEAKRILSGMTEPEVKAQETEKPSLGE